VVKLAGDCPVLFVACGFHYEYSVDCFIQGNMPTD
jgi:hypothetical protein